jgi:hypothetical protein
VPDDRSAAVHANEGGVPVSMHNRLIRLKRELGARPQDSRTGDGVHYLHGATYRRYVPLT